MKVGDIVARKSYNKDIVFKITDIIVDENGKKIAILKGVAFRIIADAELSDLEILKPPDIREILMDKNVESILYRSLKKAKDRDRRNMRGLPKSAQQPANVYGAPNRWGQRIFKNMFRCIFTIRHPSSWGGNTRDKSV